MLELELKSIENVVEQLKKIQEENRKLMQELREVESLKNMYRDLWINNEKKIEGLTK